MVTQGGRSRCGPGLHHPDRPAVAGQHVAHGKRPLPHRLSPAVVRRGQFDLGEDQIDHPVQQVLLVGHVVVQGHRLDPDGLAQLAHAERLQTAGVGEFDRGAQDPLPGERLAGLLRAGSTGHGERSLPFMVCQR